VELPSGPHSVDGDVAEFTDPMKKIALRLVAIGGTGAFAQAPHALDALVDVPGVFTARGVSSVTSPNRSRHGLSFRRVDWSWTAARSRC